MMRYLAFSIATLAVAGCQRNAVILPNSDSTLNKPAKVFAQEAAARFPYPANIERGGQLPANVHPSGSRHPGTAGERQGGDAEPLSNADTVHRQPIAIIGQL